MRSRYRYKLDSDISVGGEVELAAQDRSEQLRNHTCLRPYRYCPSPAS